MKSEVKQRAYFNIHRCKRSRSKVIQLEKGIYQVLRDLS